MDCQTGEPAISIPKPDNTYTVGGIAKEKPIESYFPLTKRSMVICQLEEIEKLKF